MALFLDSANIDDVREAVELGFVAGVTTNPGLVAKTGQPALEVIHGILEITPTKDDTCPRDRLCCSF